MHPKFKKPGIRIFGISVWTLTVQGGAKKRSIMRLYIIFLTKIFFREFRTNHPTKCHFFLRLFTTFFPNYGYEDTQMAGLKFVNHGVLQFVRKNRTKNVILYESKYNSTRLNVETAVIQITL